MMLCFDERYLKEVGILPTEIAGYIHDAGQPTAHFNVLKELGQDSRRLIVDETAPLYFVGLKEKYASVRMEEEYIRVYDVDNTEEIVEHLIKKGFVVNEIQKNKIGLEEYYIEIMSRKENE